MLDARADGGAGEAIPLAQCIGDGLADMARQEMGLHEVGGGAEPLRLLDQMRGVVFATDDDRDLFGGFIVAQSGEHLESIELGDMNIEEDKIRRQRAGQLESRSTVRRHGDTISVELELQLIKVSNVRMILDHQDAGLKRHGLPQGHQRKAEVHQGQAIS